MTGIEKRKLDKILKVIEGGQEQKAYELLRDLLIQYPDDVEGWELMLEVAHSDKERQFAENRIEQLSNQHAGPDSLPPNPLIVDDPEMPATPAGWEEREIQLALEMISSGKSDRARRIVDRVLGKEPAFPFAVYAKVLLAKNILDFRTALAELADLSTKDPEAKGYYQELADVEFEEKRKINWKPVQIVAAAIVIFLILVGFTIVAPYLGQRNGKKDPEGVEACEELIASALDVSDKRCERIGSNEVCYGNYQLVSEYDGPTGAFDTEGDVLGVGMLHNLTASPLNVVEELWGVAVFKLKATIEGTIPGQNVTFLVFGDTQLENDSTDMTAFYFSTGFGGIQCQGVDFNGLQIEMPDGYQFVFTANGVEISLEGDAVLVAQPGGEMGITLANGTAEVTSNGVTRFLEPGTSVSIPIDDNLTASGPPTVVGQVSGDQASLLCQFYGVNCPPGEVSFILGRETTAMDATELAAQTPSETPPGFVPTDPDPSADATAASNTLVPTDPPVACNQISVWFIGYGEFQITNNSESSVVLTKMTLTWPTINGQWTEINLGRVIGSFNKDSQPATHTFLDHRSNRTFYPGDSKTITMDFENGVKGGPYSAIFYFDNGCSLFTRN